MSYSYTLFSFQGFLIVAWNIFLDIIWYFWQMGKVDSQNSKHTSGRHSLVHHYTSWTYKSPVLFEIISWEKECVCVFSSCCIWNAVAAPTIVVFPTHHFNILHTFLTLAMISQLILSNLCKHLETRGSFLLLFPSQWCQWKQKDIAKDVIVPKKYHHFLAVPTCIMFVPDLYEVKKILFWEYFSLFEISSNIFLFYQIMVANILMNFCFLSNVKIVNGQRFCLCRG